MFSKENKRDLEEIRAFIGTENKELIDTAWMYVMFKLLEAYLENRPGVIPVLGTVYFHKKNNSSIVLELHPSDKFASILSQADKGEDSILTTLWEEKIRQEILKILN